MHKDIKSIAIRLGIVAALTIGFIAAFPFVSNNNLIQAKVISDNYSGLAVYYVNGNGATESITLIKGVDYKIEVFDAKGATVKLNSITRSPYSKNGNRYVYLWHQKTTSSLKLSVKRSYASSFRVEISNWKWSNGTCTSIKDIGGKCMYKAHATNKNFIKGYCGGGDNYVCFPTKIKTYQGCRDLRGVCEVVKSGKTGGHYVSNLCPGDSQIKCWVLDRNQRRKIGSLN